MIPIKHRPRRNRRSSTIRNLVQETHLHIEKLVWPVFIVEGEGIKTPIESMPGQHRMSLDELIKTYTPLYEKGLKSLALFPVISDELKSPKAIESKNPHGLIPKAIKELKSKFSDICLFTDVAMDPYSSDGHDGFVESGKIKNDITLEILAQQALVQAEAGTDYVSPSDMMDGRIGFIRKVLDDNGFSNVGIMSYAAKYASSFYGPFREALDSAPRFGDKKTYQMNPANSNEAVLEVKLDIQQGADIVMVKPAMAYMDIMQKVKTKFPSTPLAAYNVSGEYAMLKLASEKSLIDEDKAIHELLTGFFRAGADIVFTYFANHKSLY